jgi:hypothetical protein
VSTYGAGTYGGGTYGAPTGVVGGSDTWVSMVLGPEINVQLCVEDARAEPVWEDITEDVRVYARSKYGREDWFDRIETSEATITLDNNDRDYDRTYTGGAFYPDLKPLNRIRVRYRWDGVVYPRGVFFVDRWPQSYPQKGHDSLVQLRLFDGFGVAALARFPAGWSRPAETSDQRLSAVLDVLGVPAADRSFEAGVAELAAVELDENGVGPLDGNTLLPYILDIADAEGGQLFVNRAGVWTFQRRAHRNKDETTVQATFADDGTDLPYQDIVPVEQDIWTEAQVTGATGGVQEYRDEAASDEFFPRTWQRSLPLATKWDAEARGQYVVYRHNTPRTVCKNLTVLGAKDPDVLWPVLLDLDISHQIVAERFAGTGDAMTFNSYIEGNTETASPQTGVALAFQTSPADNTVYLELDAGHQFDTHPLGY